MSLEIRVANLESAVRRLTNADAPASTDAKSYYWLKEAATVQSSTTSTVSWTTFDASPYIPAGSVAALVEIEFSQQGPDTGDVQSHVRFRRRSGEIELVGALGQAAGSGDYAGGCTEKLVPVTGFRKFDYTIEAPGFDAGCIIRLIGYYK